MQTDKEAFWEIVRGGALGLGVVAFFIFMTVLLTPSQTESEKFKVVDQYNECNVVRYTDVTNRWHYFLDCSGNRP
jgi:hypothetical protein